MPSKETKMSIEDKYKQLTPHEHVLKLSGMYIGSIEKNTENMWVFDDKNDKLEKREITFVPGLYKIYDEILVNARDHTIRDRTCKTIKVSIKDNEISVWNDGIGIEVEKHKEHKIYVPELIFGHLRTGANYDKKNKIVGGKHGLGAKLTNIYSSKFTVRTKHSKTGRTFSQTYSNNMYKKTKPSIKEKTKGDGYTQIIFEPDFERFGINNLTDDICSLFKKRVYDIAACTNEKVKVYFNDELIKIKNFKQYIELYQDDQNDQNEYNDNEDNKTKDKTNIIYSEFVYDKTIKDNRWKVGVVFDPISGYNQISYVNGICTYKGGTHVNHIVEQVVNSLIKNIKSKPKNKNINIKYSHVKDNLTFYIDSVIEDPDFPSQTKDEMTTKLSNFGSKCDLDANFIKLIEKTGVVEEILDFAKLKQLAELKKSDGKKVVKLDKKKLEDANWAGKGKRALECRLILTEGDSAKTFAISGLKMLKNGRDKYGVFPLKGKLLNVRDATAKQLINNEEIKSIKEILGLKQNKTYKTKEDLKTLRYGGIIILTDQDLDGFHIKGLIINFIHFFWPQLLQNKNFITTMRTPIVKVFKKTDNKKKDGLSFFTLTDYHNWTIDKKTNLSVYTNPKYYKGLGTSKPQEAEEIFRDFDKNLIKFKWSSKQDQEEDQESLSSDDDDDEDDDEDQEQSKDSKESKNKSDTESIEDKQHIDVQAINLAFAKNTLYANKRKQWLKNYDKNKIIESTDQTMTYSTFVNKELIHFSNYDNIRSIPSVIDGFKPSQRKIVYGSIMKKIFKNEIKVAQLSGYVSDVAKYHHGEMSLQGAIVKMAQNFVGTNNINVLTPNGQFGSRLQGGDDASSARYIFTQLNELVPKIFREEDTNILKYVTDEGERVEPETYVPIIPMILVNGTHGIGTGYSTRIPSFNPCEIIKNLINKIDNKPFKKMKPWYRWFKGTVEKLKKKKEVVDNVYDTVGVWEPIGDNKIKITELPIGMWTEKYIDNFIKPSLYVDDKKSTDKKTTKQGLIKDFVNNSSDRDIDIEIEFHKNDLTELIKTNKVGKNLKLHKSVALTNMHLYDSKGFIKKYTSVEDIFNEYFDTRLKMYDTRKEYKVRAIENELKMLNNRVRFIKIRIEKISESKKIVKLNNVQTEKVIEQLVDAKFDKLHNDVDSSKQSYDYLLNMQMRSLTQENVERLEKERKNKENELNLYKNTPATEFWKRELLELTESYEKWEKYLVDTRDTNKKSKSKTKSKTKTKSKK